MISPSHDRRESQRSGHRGMIHLYESHLRLLIFPSRLYYLLRKRQNGFNSVVSH
jgi:hypothetical protein